MIGRLTINEVKTIADGELSPSKPASGAEKLATFQNNDHHSIVLENNQEETVRHRVQSGEASTARDILSSERKEVSAKDRFKRAAEKNRKGEKE